MTANIVHGAAFTAMVVRAGDPEDPEFERQLRAQIARLPQFYANAPVVLDVRDSLFYATAADFETLKRVVRGLGLVPVGVQNANPTQQKAAAAADLGVFPESAGHRRAAAGRTGQPGTPPASKTMLVQQPVRSGTQLYARGCDLIIVRSVSVGAEIIADGHVHVYGALRGRAIAGATGDRTARIFTSRLEAELVCIAGRYLVRDSIAPEHIGAPVQVALEDDRLVILDNR